MKTKINGINGSYVKQDLFKLDDIIIDQRNDEERYKATEDGKTNAAISYK